MRHIKNMLLIVSVCLASILVFLLINELLELEQVEWKENPAIETNQEVKTQVLQFEDSVFSLMDMSKEEVLEKLGEPIRKDPTAYGYTFWIYQDSAAYLQVGIMEDQVVTIVATGKGLESDPIKIGESFAQLRERFPLKKKLTYQKGISHYTFILTESDLQEHPLIQLSDDLFVQCYMDTFTKKVSSFRIITGDLLLKQRFYEMEYRGSLPDVVDLSDEEWEEVEQAVEMQIVELTNVFRERHDLKPLKTDEKVSEVAYLHSKDMYEHHYFSHESKDGRGLRDRIEAHQIAYLAAGENIAAQYSDALAAVQGWLNSKGHRDTMLSEQYNYLGVGVHRLYYTQNFIYKYE